MALTSPPTPQLPIPHPHSPAPRWATFAPGPNQGGCYLGNELMKTFRGPGVSMEIDARGGRRGLQTPHYLISPQPGAWTHPPAPHLLAPGARPISLELLSKALGWGKGTGPGQHGGWVGGGRRPPQAQPHGVGDPGVLRPGKFSASTFYFQVLSGGGDTPPLPPVPGAMEGEGAPHIGNSSPWGSGCKLPLPRGTDPLEMGEVFVQIRLTGKVPSSSWHPPMAGGGGSSSPAGPSGWAAVGEGSNAREVGGTGPILRGVGSRTEARMGCVALGNLAHGQLGPGRRLRGR